MEYQKRAACTIALIAVNVVYFLILSFGGMTEDVFYMLEHGAAYTPLIIDNQEYYRLFSSFFLHFNFAHLMNNMVTLGVVGIHLEPVMGKVRFLAVYMISGLGGNILSTIVELKTLDYAVSAGASGAVFGLTGSLLALAIVNRGRIGDITKQGMFFMVGISLYLGFASEGVDNMAHVGGLLCGMLLTFVIAPRKRMRREEELW